MKYDTRLALKNITCSTGGTDMYRCIAESYEIVSHKDTIQADISQLMLFGRLNEEKGHKACVVETKDRQKCPAENSTKNSTWETEYTERLYYNTKQIG
jgi:hypothetical protein